MGPLVPPQTTRDRSTIVLFTAQLSIDFLHHFAARLTRSRDRVVSNSYILLLPSRHLGTLSMQNAEAGPGPTTARIKLTVPSAAPSQAPPTVSQYDNDGALAVTSGQRTSSNQLPPGTQNDLGGHDVSQHHNASSQPVNTDVPVPSGPLRGVGRGNGRGRGRGRGSRGGRGGAARGTARPMGDGLQRRQNPTRSAGAKATSQIRAQGMDESEPSSSSRRVTLSFNKNGGGIRVSGESARKSSFLGDYDRDLDENPTEPLVFEEQFLLRVPERIANNLRERVKGKTKGLDGVEIKFLGEQ